jgi:hypothetical protein
LALAGLSRRDKIGACAPSLAFSRRSSSPAPTRPISSGVGALGARTTAPAARGRARRRAPGVSTSARAPHPPSAAQACARQDRARRLASEWVRSATSGRLAAATSASTGSARRLRARATGSPALHLVSAAATRARRALVAPARRASKTGSPAGLRQSAVRGSAKGAFVGEAAASRTGRPARCRRIAARGSAPAESALGSASPTGSPARAPVSAASTAATKGCAGSRVVHIRSARKELR